MLKAHKNILILKIIQYFVIFWFDTLVTVNTEHTYKNCETLFLTKHCQETEYHTAQHPPDTECRRPVDNQPNISLV